MQFIRQKRDIKSRLEKQQENGGLRLRHTSDTSSSDAYFDQEKSDTIFVKFDDDDPTNPQNWPLSRKWTTMGSVGWTGFAVGWASSIDSAILKQAMKDFGVGEVTESLATGLFLIAFGAGSLLSAPLSETIGRNPTYLLTLTLFMICTIASGLAPKIGAQLAIRFIAGFFGCTPLTTFGRSMSDMFPPLARTYVFPVCAWLSFLGPSLAPVAGAFINQSDISWRWTEWTTLILTGVITVSIALFVTRTYAPAILQWKAITLRQVTGDGRYKAESELEQVLFLKKLAQNARRLIRMFLSEIIVTLFTLYLSDCTFYRASDLLALLAPGESCTEAVD